MMQPLHDFDPLSDFCMGCGLARYRFVEQHGPLICADNDHRTALLARHRILAMAQPMLEELGFAEPETKH